MNNNPVRYTDPTGHQRKDDGGSGGTSCGGLGQPSCGGVSGSGDNGNNTEDTENGHDDKAADTQADGIQCTFTDGNNATCTVVDSEVDDVINETKIAEIAEGVLLAEGTVAVCALSAAPTVGVGCALATIVSAGFMVYESQEWSAVRNVLDVRGDVTLQISYDPSTGKVTLDNGVDRPVTLPPSFAATWVLDKFGLLSTIHY